MPQAKGFVIVFVTAPSQAVARKLALAALDARLIACANLVRGLESHYWWEGKIERGAEVLLLLKTRRQHLPALERLISAQHPYDTPEFLVVKIDQGSRKYLDWLKSSVRA